MARKLQPVDILPPPSSSNDETHDQEGSNSSTDDEQQPSPHAAQEPEESDDSADETEDAKPEPQPVVKKPSLQEPQESDDSDTDSDGTLHSPPASAFTVKPKASMHVSKNQEPGKVKGANRKRPAEKIDKVSKSKKSKVTNGEKGSKGKNVVSGDEEGGEVEEKKSPVKWTEKDELALLCGILDHKAKTGVDWDFKIAIFYEYVKDLISVDLTKNQLFEKVKRLKKKFQTNVGKWQNGEECVFSSPHDNKLFELSQKIWGGEGTVTEGNDSKVKSTKKEDKKDGIVVGYGNTSTPVKSDANMELVGQEEVKEVIMEYKKEETRDIWSLYPFLCASLESEVSTYLTVMVRDVKEYVPEIVRRMGEEKARELDDEWKACILMEQWINAKRAQLIYEQAEALYDHFICRENLRG